ncbi:hypothetical protein ACFLUC_00135 [Chloroflexota bacterium]
MLDQETTPNIIQTKLIRPQLPVDLVPRPRLTAWIEQRLLMNQHRVDSFCLVTAKI